MTLDYIHNINGSGEHMVRLYNFDQQQAQQLSEAIKERIITQMEPLDLSTLEWIESRNCVLTMRIATEDIGIITNNGRQFFCDLTHRGFQEMIDLLEPFCSKKTKGYQWLYDIDNPIDFLFSPAGTW
jgi:uncharacterized membrane-anchored protein